METARQAARRIVHESEVALARRGDRQSLAYLRQHDPFEYERIMALIAFRARVLFGFARARNTFLA